MRTSCLYCAENGVETQLVYFGRRGCCPIHSAAFIAECMKLPDGYTLVKKPDLYLSGTGRPTPRPS